MTSATVRLWGTTIGAVTWVDERNLGVFQYAPEFLPSRIELSPLTMALSPYPYEFPALPRDSFRGLPGLLADSLPDKFGNALIDSWLATQGRTPASFNPVERLCYIGSRGMGGLEFEPALVPPATSAQQIEVAKLVELANLVLSERARLDGFLKGLDDHAALEDILRVGTSAGGARAKAILAWNPATNEFRSGQLACPDGFQAWMLKFDGISNNRDKELADPLGYGKIEFAYSRLAALAGITMMPCRLHHEGGRSHFMTKRFDRTDEGGKVHMQTLGALAHVDYNLPGGYSYEQALQTMKQLGLPAEDLEQQVLRAMFNVVGRNQDDHVKNITFLMNRRGEWRLSPAYDVSYAYAPDGRWTSQHQMRINGKRDEFTRSDLIAMAKVGGLKTKRAGEMLDHVTATLKRWPEIACEADVAEEPIRQIQAAHRLTLPN